MLGKPENSGKSLLESRKCAYECRSSLGTLAVGKAENRFDAFGKIIRHGCFPVAQQFGAVV